MIHETELENRISSLRAEIRRLRKSLAEKTSPLPAMLKRRGFKIYRQGPPDDLLLPGERFIEDYYRYLQRYSFRLFLRDVIKHQKTFSLKDVTRYAAADVTKGYVDFLLALGLLEEEVDSYSLKKRPIKSFGPTLEWFLSEIFKREFGAETIWGTKFKRPVVGGDYDLIAKIDGSLLYMEVKSSPPKQIYASEISAFLDRTVDLAPEIAVFFMDTELRMKDKIVPMFEEDLRKRPPDELPVFAAGGGLLSVDRIKKELFHIHNKIFIINAKDSIVNNLEEVLSRYFRRVK
ncbi:MAG TPA: hypothetical protein VN328_08110 [Thermodesulfovibrionales bacterium]|nr:hypothetical protein [Thermodesulfovibrionales bacterium]